MLKAVEPVLLATGHIKCQMVLETSALTDHSLHATALAREVPSDTHATDAQLDLSKTHRTSPNAILHNVMDLTRLDFHSMPHHAEDARSATGQDIFQTHKELLVF